MRLASAAPSSHSFATSSRDESAAGQQKAGEASSTAAAAVEAEEELVPHTFVTVPAFSDDTIKVSVTEWFAEEGARLADGAALCSAADRSAAPHSCSGPSTRRRLPLLPPPP